jgi:predicted O-methyltransferase YrrM
MERALLYARTIAYSSEQVLQFTYDMAVKYRDSPGVYVECGVAAGAQIIAMAAGAPNKTIYAFDSFEGIPFPSNRDDQMPGIR